MLVEIQVFSEDTGERTALLAEEGLPIGRALRGRGLLAQPCGVGKCGKCLILAETAPEPEERRLLDGPVLAGGYRLACHTKARAGLAVRLPKAAELRVLTSYALANYPYEPILTKVPVEPQAPALDDQAPDLDRLVRAAGAESHSLSLRQIAGLPAFMRGEERAVLLHGRELLGYSSAPGHAAFVVDIGTTTVAALLFDLERRVVLGVRGEKNAQAPFGADVVSRVQRGLEEGQALLTEAILKQINALAAAMLREHGLGQASLYVLAGNTTMLHFLLGLPAENISRAPFIPVSTQALRRNARELGLEADAPVWILPGISAYIGADIVAALLAADAGRAERNFLLIDFGTNAETVLYAQGRFYACSAAAGPCFEGASLACGLPGQPGAIDKVFAGPDGAAFTVLDGLEARGICGSGIVDALALLLDSGHLDETGRLSAAPEGPGVLPDACIRGVSAAFSDLGFHLTPSVHISQKDVREVQLAKAAVRAGIEVLLNEAGLEAGAVETLYLAGGFGSALSPASAARLGFIPASLAGRVSVLGNAAAFGALRYVTEKDARRTAERILNEVEYIELSAHPGFTERYVEQMTFPGGGPEGSRAASG